MRRHRILVLLLTTTAAAAVHAADFTGEWRLDVSRSQFAQQRAPASKVVQIDHLEPMLRMTVLEQSAAGQRLEGTTFHSTDGEDRVNIVLGNSLKSTAKWDGATLVIRTSGKFGANEIALDDRYELSADGKTLTLRRHFEGPTTQDQVLVHQRVDLRAGVARVEITPKALMAMYGYANRRCGPAVGTHDPLWAKVLVLESAVQKVAIVTLDLGSLVSDALRKRVAEELGIPVLLLAASHTHSGPFFLPPSRTPTSALGAEPPEAPAYRAELEAKLFTAIRQAAGAMFPARLKTGSGSMRLGYNRLQTREHGRSQAVFNNLERIPYGPLDSEFGLLEVTDLAGAPKALLVHYAVHSVVLGPTNCKYSADYPGAMQKAVETAVPGVQAMFVQGGAGDINPVYQARSGKDDEDFGMVDRMGQLLAAEVVKSRSRMRAVDTESLPLRARMEVLELGDRWQKDRKHEVGIATVLIGREIAIAAMPGEPMHLLQTAWKARADVPFPLFYGYTFSAGGEWPGYLPDLKSAAYGGYGGDSTATRVEVGAGERLIERHLYHLFELKGMWRDVPGVN
jgi:hypothetical protein